MSLRNSYKAMWLGTEKISVTRRPKLELTWMGKAYRPKLKLRILLVDDNQRPRTLLLEGITELRKQMMELSPKAIRFIIEAVEHYQTYHEERLRDEHLTEADVADLTNDQQYSEAPKTDLRQ